MPRPKKNRNVCCLPAQNQFGPLNKKELSQQMITMTVVEYETIRLIDLESFTQEECAQHMDVARTTVQGIYNKARKKLAESLVHGKRLMIEGGDYVLCNGKQKKCRDGGCFQYGNAI